MLNMNSDVQSLFMFSLLNKWMHNLIGPVSSRLNITKSHYVEFNFIVIQIYVIY